MFGDRGRLGGELVKREDAILVDAAGGLREEMLRGYLVPELGVR